MNNLNEESIINKKIKRIKLDWNSESFKNILDTKTKLNKIYSNEKLRIQSGNLVFKDNRKEHKICNFFVIPTHKIYYFDGSKKEKIGLRIRLYTNDQNKMTKITELTITNELINNGKWIDKYLADDYILYKNEYYVHLKKAIKLSSKLLKKKDKEIYTDRTGWIKGSFEWYYVPVTDPDIILIDETGINYDKGLSKKYSLTEKKGATAKEAFLKTLDMIDAIDKKISIPLISYTLLSLITSIIKPNNKPKTLLCLIGNNSTISKEGLANIYCNIYNRNAFINNIDSELHSDFNHTQKELKENILKARDYVIILKNIGIDTKEKQDKIKMLFTLLQNDKLHNNILGLSKDNLERENTFNIDISNIVISSDDLKMLQNKSKFFSTFLLHFIYSLKQMIQRDKKIFNKQFKKRIRYFEKEHSNIDFNIAKLFSWLMVMYELFLIFGVKAQALDEKSAKSKLSEATEIYKELSVKANTENNNINSESLKKQEAKLFLDAITKMTAEVKLLRIKEKPHEENDIIGWEDDTALYLKNKVWNLINNFSIRPLTIEKKELYQYLYDRNIINGQLERNNRIRFDYNKNVYEGKKERVLYIFKEKMKNLLEEENT
ncbi:hypothetical protein [Aneurinibacillus aneurinilyticus]|nr:hypothetical protein [Aneurinibacillus aneurinilyticus]MED0705265.1 hypothetical protein [Aneurinibacillus aneurinilyticus]MED0722487.1 hypothetical protein [Aneurinibacillus aneurinilyticus]MED0733797.1 hypothetical protein [Aneurinibacillus aneurinilyticus]MED0739682.1 hypothetical protein [Aneurinibacillus aneurinilyticus]